MRIGKTKYKELLNKAIKKQVTNYRFILLLIIGFSIFVEIHCQSENKEHERKTVLLLFTYSQDMPYIDIAMKSIRKTFDSNASNIKIDFLYEIMNFDQIEGKEHLFQLLKLYELKYYNKKIDLVFIHNRRIIDFWIKNRNKIFSEVPPMIVYDLEPETLSLYKDSVEITGVTVSIDYIKSVQWFIKKYPLVNKIVLVNGAGANDSAVTRIKPINVLKKQYEDKLKIVSWSKFSLPEIKHKAANLTNNTLILYLTMFEDAAGIHYRPYDALKEIAKVSSVPILSSYSQFIGTGTIGGHVFSVEEAAGQATIKGIRILNGESVSNIPVSSELGNHFIFDHEALINYDIPLSALPPESIIKNRQYKLWEKYKYQIIVIISSFIFLVLLVVFLIILTKKLNKTRLALSDLNTNLEAQVQKRTEQLSSANNALKSEILERKRIEENLVKLNVTKDKFFSIIAHDLRSPFASMCSFLELMINMLKNRDFSQVEKMMKIINNQTKHTH